MRWDAIELARLARNAGFHRDLVPTAAAVALATSGGCDTYDFSPGAPGSGRYVGLWGVDVDRWPEHADVAHHDPREAARVAYELTQAEGGFGWSPAHVAGAHLPYVAHAATEMTRENDAQQALRAPVPLGAARHVASLLATVERLHRTRQNIRQSWRT